MRPFAPIRYQVDLAPHHYDPFQGRRTNDEQCWVTLWAVPNEGYHVQVSPTDALAVLRQRYVLPQHAFDSFLLHTRRLIRYGHSFVTLDTP